MSPKKHEQRRRARTTAKALYDGRHVQRRGKRYMRCGFIDDNGARSDGYWLIKPGRRGEIFFNDDFTPRPA